MKHTARFAFASSLLTLLTTFAVSSAAFASGTTLQTVACPDKGLSKIDLYNSSGETSGIRLDAYEVINAFQGWGTNTITKGKGSKALNFVRITVPSQPKLMAQNLFIFEGSIISSSQCETKRGEKATAVAGVAMSESDSKNKKTDEDKAGDDEGDDDGADEAPEETVTSTTGLAALKATSCCGYPIATRPRSFLAGIGRFGAARKGSRTHGGADLYGTAGQAVFAIAPGTVLRAPYFFKARTLAVDIRHEGGFVIRYGEISGKSFGLDLNSVVKKGQQLGDMKYVPGAPSPMLHFELYKGNIAGKLSTSGNEYNRRDDIINPTPYLLNWAMKQ